MEAFTGDSNDDSNLKEPNALDLHPKLDWEKDIGRSRFSLYHERRQLQNPPAQGQIQQKRAELEPCALSTGISVKLELALVRR